MHIEKINDNKIRVTVNREDTKIWNVSIKNLTDNTPEAQDLFWFALRQAEKDVDFKIGKSQILVEALPNNSDGFIMMISKIDSSSNIMDILGKSGHCDISGMDISVKKRTRKAPHTNIFKFLDFEDLCNCVEQIKDIFSGRSKLYKYKEEFYLCIVPNDTMMFFETENILLEYATKVSNSFVTEGLLREHGTVMIKENAFETVLTYFN